MKGRADWLSYVVGECEGAVQQGCELHGITLYPIVNHPGWEDDRRCENGLWDYADARGQRAIHEPLAREILRHTPRLAAAKKAMLTRYARNAPEPRHLDYQP